MSRKAIQLPIDEAMENLALLGTLSTDHLPRLGITEGGRLVVEGSELLSDLKAELWLSSEGVDPLFHLLDMTYRAILSHFTALYESEETDWADPLFQKGILATMAVMGEGAKRLELYLARMFEKEMEGCVRKRVSYVELDHFYHTAFQKKFIDLTRSQDLAPLLADQTYELLQIVNEAGEPYYSQEILQKLEIEVDFGADTLDEDPLLRLRYVVDRDLHASAVQILTEVKELQIAYFHLAAKLERSDCMQHLGSALLALMLAANPRHLIQNTAGKSCINYFADFQFYLRKALQSSHYQKLIAYPPGKEDKNGSLLFQLSHSLAKALFCRKGGVRGEAIALIHRTMRLGEDRKTKLKGDTVVNQLMIDDEKIRTYLAKFPSGPLFKMLDLLREGEIPPFDPLMQGVIPMTLFQLEQKRKEVSILQIPCPVRQREINRTEIAEEFLAFLRSLSPAKPHLMIDLQDSTSWRECGRTQALEALERNAEFHSLFVVLRLAKDTPFYHQSGDFEAFSKAEDFIRQFVIEIGSGGGFHFSTKLRSLEKEAPSLFREIHAQFFDGHEILSREERQDFIEIAYLHLIKKAMEITHTQSLSFSCKDSVDTGASMAALFYTFMKQEAVDVETIRYLLYSPSLFIRERAADVLRTHRAISAMQKIL